MKREKPGWEAIRGRRGLGAVAMRGRLVRVKGKRGPIQGRRFGGKNG
jgi:hypothetical protein